MKHILKQGTQQGSDRQTLFKIRASYDCEDDGMSALSCLGSTLTPLPASLSAADQIGLYAE
jgi:hypothetical protein